MKKISLFFAALYFLLPSPANAFEWQLDPPHSNFYFEIKHIYSTIRGRFSDYSGKVFFDPEHPEKSRIELRIKVDSIDTDEGKRDTHLRSADFFDTNRFPEMKFTSSRITRAGENRYAAEGTLTIKDVSREMVLEFVYHGQKDHPAAKGQVVAGLDSRLSLNRLDFAVGDGKFSRMGLVDKEVNILISLEILRDK